jgi:hypothetical protein
MAVPMTTGIKVETRSPEVALAPKYKHHCHHRDAPSRRQLHQQTKIISDAMAPFESLCERE